jgi:protein AATF/BFR2
VQVIDETLVDHPQIVARTQVRRGKSSRIGEAPQNPNGDEPDVEVFDDTDFYQQLLRDVIDSHGHGVEGVEDWIVTQKQQRVKKKVDTKASKGRKLR